MFIDTAESYLQELPLLASYRPPQASMFDSRPEPLIIAGPCAVESEESLDAVATLCRSLDVRYLRGGAFKHRTLPYSFSGLGEEGFLVLRRVADRHGLLVVSEVVDREQLELASTCVDVLMLGARNMRNYWLLKAVGALGRPVILKRGMDATLFEWLGAAEHLLVAGAQDVALCERGVRWHDPAFRNLLDLASVLWVKEHLSVPIIVDPSHAIGVPALIPAAAKTAVLADADGVMVEVHMNPGLARCDGFQALTFEQLRCLVECVRSASGRVHAASSIPYI